MNQWMLQLLFNVVPVYSPNSNGETFQLVYTKHIRFVTLVCGPWYRPAVNLQFPEN